MSKRDSNFFLDDGPPNDVEVDLLRHLKPWHRIGICIVLVATMLGYLGWLTKG